ncbi:DUF3822 family protein [Sediminibacterium soli]|uniref:DUF3822 family protein n=1 Tax=Sediminibacterium soli TaxID=2698829 RepID=UPI00137B5556|nr:DUF3822 family protein [Sediminibacterium soli]NCI46301.1 DUF3822 family protein [Sediminibacterium soli]
MIKKLAGYYNEPAMEASQDARLLLEFCPSEVACVCTENGALSGLELFSTEEEWEKTFGELLAGSRILNRNYREVTCYYLSEEALVVPAQKFDPAAAADYLALVFGERYHHDTMHDALANGEQVTAYHIDRNLHDLVGRQYVLYKPRHVYSGILNKLLARTDLPAHLLHLQVYRDVCVLSLIRDGRLLLIRHFSYRTAEDILYYLISVLQQFPVPKNSAYLEITGRMEEGFLNATRLGKLFGEISCQVPATDPGSLLAGLTEYPSYYFTPLINLAI